MKKIVFLFTFSSFILGVNAQVQIQNGGFETWDNDGTE